MLYLIDVLPPANLIESGPNKKTQSSSKQGEIGAFKGFLTAKLDRVGVPGDDGEVSAIRLT